MRWDGVTHESVPIVQPAHAAPGHTDYGRQVKTPETFPRVAENSPRVRAAPVYLLSAFATSPGTLHIVGSSGVLS